MSSYLYSKHFAVEEAQAIITDILPKIEKLVSLKQILDAKGFDIYKHQYYGGMGPNGDRFFPQELEELVEIAKDFEVKGIIIKSLNEGLIDFPHIRSNKEEVFLCWKLGEDKIGFWHSLSAGFAGRKPLTDL
jgi:hypothetical protein